MKYHRSVLEAKIYFGSSFVCSIASEPIENSEEYINQSEEKIKQDCESRKEQMENRKSGIQPIEALAGEYRACMQLE